MRVLVTGSSGFIGSHIVDALREGGHDVRTLDLRSGEDVRDEATVSRRLDGVDAVCHQAAMVGLGLDFGDAEDYVAVNELGTARLLSALARRGFRGPLVLASSMVVYGEGGYECAVHGAVRPAPRSREDLEAGRFDPPCPVCGEPLAPRSIDEDAPLDPRSVYAATKLAQEHLCALFARESEGVSCTMLRYHNVYGPRMPRDTPYAGVASIFRSAIAAGRAPRVFEDGAQLRDFVHVGDVARANLLALERVGPPAAFNVASGRPESILTMAELLCREAGEGAPAPEVTGEFRLGDVRHVFADPGRARAELGFEAEIGLAEGMAEFATAQLR